MLGTIITLIKVPAVADLIQKLSSKLLSRKDKPNQGIDPKLTAALLPLTLLELALAIVKVADPGLSLILEANKEVLLQVVALVGAVFAYYTPNAGSLKA